MPWKESTQVEARRRFVEDWLTGEFESVAALCVAHGVSRKTGYKWIARFKEGGTAALADQSKRWHSHPQTTPAIMVEQIVALRRKHPSWGPKKLRTWLSGKGYDPPCPSTIGAILKREGCVKPRRRRERPGEYSDGLTAQDAPNAVWAADFKGWFRLKNGKKCYPLTVSDGFSRFLLRCEALEHPDDLACREAFDGLFREHGLPTVLRTDNGTPFSGRYGVSSLSVWWVKLGIQPERIQRGKPTQNGRHERIHRTLNEDVLKAGEIKSRMYHQQRVFDRFRKEYNLERPHEALDQQVPAQLYLPSERRYPCPLRQPEYPSDWDVHAVRRDGSIRIPGRALFLSSALVDEPVALQPNEDGSQAVWYGPLLLGRISAKGRFTRGTRPSKRDPDAPDQELQAAAQGV